MSTTKDALVFNEAYQMIGLAVVRLHQHGLEVNLGNILDHLQAHETMAEDKPHQRQVVGTAMDMLGDI